VESLEGLLQGMRGRLAELEARLLAELGRPQDRVDGM
jgi:hypothetical protein